mmetsp:Transcript_36925/g.106332  ORF Transcript_36925/g.106332 Transcript_36925/m.106332 type:complete len:203 (+) Transcript_36925:912-1520(+)
MMHLVQQALEAAVVGQALARQREHLVQFQSLLGGQLLMPRLAERSHRQERLELLPILGPGHDAAHRIIHHRHQLANRTPLVAGVHLSQRCGDLEGLAELDDDSAAEAVGVEVVEATWDDLQSLRAGLHCAQGHHGDARLQLDEARLVVGTALREDADAIAPLQRLVHPVVHGRLIHSRQHLVWRSRCCDRARHDGTTEVALN